MPPFRRRRAADWRAFFCFLSILLMLIPAGSLFFKTEKPEAPKKKRGAGSAAASGSPGEISLTNIPLPIGHEAKGLVLPDFNTEGKLRAKFEAGTAHRIDQEHIGFRQLKITTFTPDSQTDLRVDMHTSVLDLKTRILSSQERT